MPGLRHRPGEHPRDRPAGHEAAGEDRRVRGGHGRDRYQQKRHQFIAATRELRRHHSADDRQAPQPNTHRGQEGTPPPPDRVRPVEQRYDHDEVREAHLEEGNGDDERQDGHDQYDFDRRRGRAQRFADAVKPLAGRSCGSSRGPSLGRMLLPRAHPCIAHYRLFTGAHNRIPPGNARVQRPGSTSGEGPGAAGDCRYECCWMLGGDRKPPAAASTARAVRRHVASPK